MRRLMTGLLFGMLAVSTISAARADSQLLYLTEDVPVSLDPDGPSSTVNTSQVGRINMLEPLIGYAIKGTNDEGIRIPDFAKYEGRLVETWDYDPESITWTLHLRHGVIGCSGNEFTADDVAYTLARAKSISGATTVAWFSGSVAGYGLCCLEKWSAYSLRRIASVKWIPCRLVACHGEIHAAVVHGVNELKSA